MELETLLACMIIELYLCVAICHFVTYRAIAHLTTLVAKAFPARQRNDIASERDAFLKTANWSLAWPALFAIDMYKYINVKLKKSE
tara:strand:+ start:99 stop:356 length:258 start_codon:yes stop_codon:yes gene_type:complete